MTDVLLTDTQPRTKIDDVHANGHIKESALHLQEIMAGRRSIRRLQDGPFSAAARNRLLEAIRLTPAAYNLPPWRVILVHERRDDLWTEIERGFRETLSNDRLERYLERLRGFREGVAVALVFVDHRVERTLREEKGASPRVAQGFVQQALGMVQLSLWLAVTAEGMVTSLQHWDEWIGSRAARFAGLADDDFALIATLPIGYPAEEPKAIERATTEQICAVDPQSLS